MKSEGPVIFLIDGNIYALGELHCDCGLESRFYTPTNIGPEGVVFIQVSYSECLTMAVSSTGEVYTWDPATGRKSRGAETPRYYRGDAPAIEPHYLPHPIENQLFPGVTKIACSNSIFSAYDGVGNGWMQREDGNIVRLSDLIGVPVYIKELAAGRQHFLALSASGDMFACGDNSQGQLGTGDTHPQDGVLILNLSGNAKITHISALMNFSACTTEDGQVWYFGNRTYQGWSNPCTVPTLIPFTAPKEGGRDSELVQIICGDGYVCVQADDGTMWGTGYCCPFVGAVLAGAPDSNDFSQLDELAPLRGMRILTSHPFMVYMNPKDQRVFMVSAKHNYTLLGADHGRDLKPWPYLAPPKGKHSSEGIPNELKLNHKHTCCQSIESCFVQ